MVTVPRYSRQQVAVQPLGNVRQQIQVSPETFGAGQARALEQGGRDFLAAGRQIGAAAIDSARRQTETEARQAIADWRKRTTPILTDYQSQQGRNAVNGYTALPGQLDSVTAEVRGQLSGDRARELFDEAVTARRTALDATTAGHYHRQLRLYEVGALGALFESAVEQGIAAPETIPQQVQEIRAAATELQALTGESDEEREGRILTAVTSMHAAVIDRLLVDGNVTVAAAHFETHQEAMLPSQQARVGRRIEVVRKQGMALAQAQLRTGIQDEIASLRRTGQRAGVVSDAQIQAAYGEQAGDIIDGLNREAAFYEVRQEVATNTPAEDAALLESLRPEGEGFREEAERYDLLLKAAQDKYAALAADPAAYVMQTQPQIAAAFSNSTVTPGQAVALRMQAQEQLGVPSWRLTPLTTQEAESLVGEIQALPTASVAGEMLSLERQYGGQWPAVFSQMAGEGLSQPLQLLGSVAGEPGLSQTLAQAIENGETELTKGMGVTEPADFRVLVETAMGEFRAAFEAADPTGGVVRQVNGITNAAHLLALQYRRNGRDDPVNDAVNDLVLSRFHVSTDGAFRGVAPRVMQGRALELSEIERGAEFLLTRESLEASDLLPIGDVVDTPEFLDFERTIRAAETSGFLANNELNDGVVLMVAFDSGGAIPLVNRQGQRIEYSYEELLTAGRRGRAAEGRRETPGDIRREEGAPQFRPRTIPTPERAE